MIATMELRIMARRPINRQNTAKKVFTSSPKSEFWKKVFEEEDVWWLVVVFGVVVEDIILNTD